MGSKGIVKRGLAGALLVGTALVTVGTGFPAAAQEAGAASAGSRPFDIGPQSLQNALTIFGQQAGIQVSVDAAVVRGLSSPGVSGSLAPQVAVDRLLAGTGLSYRFTSPTTVLVSQPNAGAEDAGLAANGSTVLPTIVISGKTGRNPADAPYETPGSSNYISGEQIQRFRGTSPADIFRGTPGVLSGDARNSGAIDVNIRGLQGMNRVPVTVDGAFQSTTVYRGYAGVANRSYVDPDLIGGVAVQKGPSMGASGSGAVGGLVSMRTIEAGDIVQEGRKYGIRVKAGMNTNSSSPPATGSPYGARGAGFYNVECVGCESEVQLPPAGIIGSEATMDRPSVLEPTAGSGSVAAAVKEENYEIVAAYARRKNGNYYSGKNGGRQPTLYKSADTSNAGAYPPGTPGYRLWEIWNIDGLSVFRGGEEMLNTSNDTTSALIKGTVRFAEDHSLQLGYMYFDSLYGELMPSAIMRGLDPVQRDLSHVRVDTYTARYNWNPADNDAIDLEANLWKTRLDANTLTGTLFPDNVMMHALTDSWGGDISNTTLLDTGIGPFTLNYGGSARFEDTRPLTLGTTYPPPDGTREEYSLFANGQWDATSWLTLNAGIRWTTFETEDRREAAATPTLRERKDSGFAPIFSATFKPMDGIQLYGQYAEGLRMASLMESTRAYSSNPRFDLEPEHARNWEFGVNFSKDDFLIGGDKARLKLAYFDNTTDNYIARISQAGFSTFPYNLDKARFKGFELSGSWDTGPFFMEASATYYTDMQFCIDDTRYTSVTGCISNALPFDYARNQLPPEFSTSITLGARFLEDSLTLGTRITHMGSRGGNTIEGTGGTLNIIEWDPFTVVDVFGSYKLNDTLALDFSGENIFDRYYMDPLTSSLMPAPGRTIRATLTKRF